MFNLEKINVFPRPQYILFDLIPQLDILEVGIPL